MSKTDLLLVQASFVARLETMTAFLEVTMDFITAANHKLTDNEKAGFHYCIEALRRNAKGVIKIGKQLQEIETRHV